ncbi:MAG: hypothetical protein CL843_04110 [Crocinitomicaceae bacterium]|nr:hypothetical protein [Crocinitomicaceae bacterium]|tara:strand:- start:35504 stop:36184 length:681 start_codon:yes stop_codon:yes gene_type:complete
MWKFWSNKKTIPKQVDHFPEEVQLYLRQIEEGRKIKSSVRETSYVVFDLETTGLNTAKDHILSFAFVRVENGQIRLKDRLEGYLNIGENAIQAAEIHHVTKSDTLQGADEYHFILAVLKFIGNSVLVGHHVAFDKGCLDQLMKEHFGFELLNKTVDTAQLGARIENPMMSGYAGKKAFKNLDALCKDYEIVPEARHSASGDTYTTALLFLKLMRKAEQRKIAEIAE